MAEIDNPRKEHQFSISIPGLNEFLCQEVTVPEDGFEVTEHGGTGTNVKTAGKRTIGSLRIDKILEQDGNDIFWTEWADQMFDQVTGGGLPPSLYKRVLTIRQFANDNITVVGMWKATGSFPQKMNGVKFGRTSSSNTVESIEFSVDRYYQVI